MFFGGMKKVLLFGLAIFIIGLVVGNQVFSLSFLGLIISSAIVLTSGMLIGASVVYMATSNPFVKDVLQGNWEEEYGGEGEEVDLQEAMSSMSDGEITADELLEGEEKSNS